MIAGEQKIIVHWANPQPPKPASLNPVSLAGATVILKIVSPTGILLSRTMTVVSTDPNVINHYAYYRTDVTDFPVGGVYSLQVFGTFPDGTSLKIPKCLWNIGDSF